MIKSSHLQLVRASSIMPKRFQSEFALMSYSAPTARQDAKKRREDPLDACNCSAHPRNSDTAGSKVDGNKAHIDVFSWGVSER